MPWVSHTEKEVVEKNSKRFLRDVSVEFNREVKRKLTYEYLGIWTGTLRNTTGAIIDGSSVLFGINMGYGYGYETGDWSKANQYGNNSFLRKNGYAGESYAEYRKRNPKKAEWSGDKHKRPFVKDTIEDKDVQSRIMMRFRNAG